MKPLKAIEIITSYPIKLETPQDHDFFEAILLAIAALKVCHNFSIPLQENQHGKVNGPPTLT